MSDLRDKEVRIHNGGDGAEFRGAPSFIENPDRRRTTEKVLRRIPGYAFG